MGRRYLPEGGGWTVLHGRFSPSFRETEGNPLAGRQESVGSL